MGLIESSSKIREKRLLIVLLNLATALTVAIENPSGSCHNGRPAPSLTWFTPGEDNVYLKDCNLDFLDREYWRVFSHSNDSDSLAYIVPRPDGKGLAYSLCEVGEGNKNAELLEKYQLCQESISNLTAINNMDPVDALAIAHLLHGHLVFRAVNLGEDPNPLWEIDPFAYDDDIKDACDLLDSEAGQNHAAASYCLGIRKRCNEDGVCKENAILPSRQAVQAVAPALNRLYGIETNDEIGTSSTSDATPWNCHVWLTIFCVIMALAFGTVFPIN